jgi:S1-C subfamily serine protease
VINDLVQYGRVRRPSLGIRTLPIGPELADELGLSADYGLLIMQVAPGGAADEAGLRGGSQRAYLGNTPIMIGGDLIVAVNGERVEEEQDLAHVMNNLKAGDVVTVTIWRGKRKLDVKVTLQEVRADRRA